MSTTGERDHMSSFGRLHKATAIIPLAVLSAAWTASLAGAGELYSYWEGPTETALYYYGPSASRIRELIGDVLSTHPLAQLSRVEQLTP